MLDLDIAVSFEGKGYCFYEIDMLEFVQAGVSVEMGPVDSSVTILNKEDLQEIDEIGETEGVIILVVIEKLKLVANVTSSSNMTETETDPIPDPNPNTNSSSSNTTDVRS